MKQVAILGLDTFGKNVLEELLKFDIDVLIVDKDKELIDNYKDSDANAIVLDILNVETLRKILPESTDAVVIDMGKRLEASILATSYCAKLNIPSIIAIADSHAHGEILSLVGATKVIFPNIEAARRLTRQLMSKSMLNYMEVNEDLAIGELTIPDFLIGKSLLESGLRTKYDLNLLFIRSADGDFKQCEPNYIFNQRDVGLFAGSDKSLNNLSSEKPKEKKSFFKNAFLSKIFGFGDKI